MKLPHKPLSPALVALCIQCLALPVVLGISVLWTISAQQKPPTDALFVMQALFASVLAYLLLKDFWWRYIQLIFPLAICIALRFDIPNYVFFVGFIIFASLFWTCFKTQVPFYPSSPLIREQIASLIPDNQLSRFIDIGSGIGDLSLSLARQKPAALISGIEIAPLPWLISAVRAHFTHSRATFKLGNYQNINFSSYHIVFAYLSPAAMDDLRIKAQSEMRRNSLLISHEFPVPELNPAQIFPCASGTKQTYVYVM